MPWNTPVLDPLVTFRALATPARGVLPFSRVRHTLGDQVLRGALHRRRRLGRRPRVRMSHDEDALSVASRIRVDAGSGVLRSVVDVRTTQRWRRGLNRTR